jgi:hypothetical protein
MRILLAVLLVPDAAQDQKLPVPNAADQKKAEAEIRAAFENEYAKKTRDDGVLDEVGICNRALTEAEIQTLASHTQ